MEDLANALTTWILQPEAPYWYGTQGREKSLYRFVIQPHDVLQTVVAHDVVKF